MIQGGLVRRVNPRSWHSPATRRGTPVPAVLPVHSPRRTGDGGGTVPEADEGRGGPVPVTLRVIRKDGSIVWVNSARSPSVGNGKPATINFLVNITVRIQAEEALVRQKDYLDAIRTPSQTRSFVKDEEHRRVLGNDAYCRFTGFTREEMLNRSDYRALPRESADHLTEEDNRDFDLRYREGHRRGDCRPPGQGPHHRHQEDPPCRRAGEKIYRRHRPGHDGEQADRGSTLPGE